MRLATYLTVAVALLASSAFAAQAPLMHTPSGAGSPSFQSGFEAAMQKNQERKQQVLDALAKQGRDAAEAGIAYDEQEWSMIYRSLTNAITPAISGELLESMRRTQNAMASRR